MGKLGRIILLLLICVQGHAIEVVEAWDDYAIQNRYNSEEVVYSRLLSFLSYEGPLGIFPTVVYRIYDDIDVRRLKQEAKSCARIAKKDLYIALECALNRADEYIAEVEETNGLCRVSAEVTRILINNLGFWQIKAWNRNLTLSSYGHVVTGIRIATQKGSFKYVIDVANWGNELFPLNHRAIDYHIEHSELPAPKLRPQGYPAMRAL